MKVFICPSCGWIRAVSRRKEVECFKCGQNNMELTRMTYEKYASMSEEERENYSESWLYIHNRTTGNAGMRSGE